MTFERAITDNTITLRTGGVAYYGWLSMSITAGLEQAARSFAFPATQMAPGEDQVVLIRPGDLCTVSIGNDTVCTGFVDAIDFSHGAEENTFSVSGRSATADLVDCSVIAETGTFRNKSILQMAGILARDYGVAVVTDQAIVDLIPKFRTEQGESVYEAIERMARLEALLVTDTVDGELLLTRSGATKAFSFLRVGGEQGNVLRGTGRFDASGLYTEYRIKGQNVGTDTAFGVFASQSEGTASDDTLGRDRVLIIQGEGRMSSARAKQRAIWEAATRAGQASEMQYTVQGWRQENGDLWAPNQLVDVVDPLMGVDAELLIAEVTYSLSNEEGTTTTLTVVPQAKYELLEPAKRTTSGKRKAQAGIGQWSELDLANLPASPGGF